MTRAEGGSSSYERSQTGENSDPGVTTLCAISYSLRFMLLYQLFGHVRITLGFSIPYISLPYLPYI